MATTPTTMSGSPPPTELTCMPCHEMVPPGRSGNRRRTNAPNTTRATPAISRIGTSRMIPLLAAGGRDQPSQSLRFERALSAAVLVREPVLAERAQINVRVPGHETYACEDTQNREGQQQSDSDPHGTHQSGLRHHGFRTVAPA